MSDRESWMGVMEGAMKEVIKGSHKNKKNPRREFMKSI